MLMAVAAGKSTLRLEPQHGGVVWLNKGSCHVIGRQPAGNDVVIEHPSISRQHAAIVSSVEAGVVVVVDLGSSEFIILIFIFFKGRKERQDLSERQSIDVLTLHLDSSWHICWAKSARAARATPTA